MDPTHHQRESPQELNCIPGTYYGIPANISTLLLPSPKVKHVVAPITDRQFILMVCKTSNNADLTPCQLSNEDLCLLQDHCLQGSYHPSFLVTERPPALGPRSFCWHGFLSSVH